MAGVKWKRRGVAALTVLGVAGAAAVASGATGQLTDVSNPSGASAFAGDGGAVSSATFSSPQLLVRAPDGAAIVDDWVDQVVRRIDPITGVVTTIAGKPGVTSASSTGANGDGAAATNATLNRPSGIAFLRDGTMLIADAYNNRIRAVSPGGTISTVAGTGLAGDTGDGGAATAAKLDTPLDVGVLANGKDFVIADSNNDRIRKVNSNSGKISAYAGKDGSFGQHDDAAALQATFHFPQSLSSPDGGSSWFVVDRFGPTVRRIGAGGVTTVAGQAGQIGTPTDVGDGGPATAATLDLPLVVKALPDGGFLVSDAQHFRIRRVVPDGTISTVAGTGVAGYDGNGPLSTGRINQPVGLLPEADGSLLFVDWRGSTGVAMRLRRAGVNLPTTAPVATPTPVVTTPTPAPATPTGPGVDTSGGLAPAVAPVPGESIELDKAGKGTVYVRLPGADKAVPLQQASSVPVGSVVDARNGKVALTSARNRTGKPQTGTFWGARFKIGQRKSTRYMTELHLRGGSFASCPSAAPTGAVSRLSSLATAAKAKGKRKRSVRKLWGKDHGGRFETHGRDSVATVRGTRWLTEDRCDGTVTRVKEGVVAVKDDGRAKPVLVRKGHSHLARHQAG